MTDLRQYYERKRPPIVGEEMGAQFPEDQFNLHDTEFGAETQALFEANDPGEFIIPNLELSPSPNMLYANPKIPTTPSKFLTNTDEWVAKRARRYNVDSDMIWWILERTTGRPKMAIKTLKSFLKNNGTPLKLRL